MRNCLKQYSILSLGITSLFLWTACDLNKMDTAKGAIVLGDPSTIVTETDAQYLEDAVTDLNDSVLQEEAILVEEKDTFNNVATAQRLAQQQTQDSIAAAKAAKEKEAKEREAAKKKEKSTEKKKAGSKKQPQQKEKDKKKRR